MSSSRRKVILAAAIIMLPSLVAALVFWRLNAIARPESPSVGRLAALPKIILWAWERPEDLTFVDPQEVGIAILTATIQIKGDECIIRPRLQSARTPKDAFIIAVTRIETSREQKPALSDTQRQQILDRILETSRNSRVAAVQIDFDARASEREFYKQLLTDLRQQLPVEMPLSITALASWCLYDNWIRDLPVDEVVPMLFRMGMDANRVRRDIEAGGDFRMEIARHSLGIATDEPLTRLPSRRRVYIFCQHAWTADVAQNVIQEVKQWQ
jgi:hypothetical protein